MMIGSLGSRNVWFMPWDGMNKAFYVKYFLLPYGDVLFGKYDPGETPEWDVLLKGREILAESEPVLIQPKHGKLTRHVIHHSSVMFGDPEISVDHEIQPLNEFLKETSENISWHVKNLFRRAGDRIAEFMHRKSLDIEFREVDPEAYEYRLWLSECPICFRQIMLEEGQHEPDPNDPYDTNLIVWLEGQYMKTHDHPLTMKAAKDAARDILLQHLREGCANGEIDIDEERYIPNSEEKCRWDLTAKRNSDGALEASCLLCEAEISYPKDATLRRAAEWSLTHGCPSEDAGEPYENETFVI